MKTVTRIFAIVLVLGLVFGFTTAEKVIAADGEPVCNTNSGLCYNTIQAAITAATSGDTIYVANGTYAESLNIYKSLTLTGESEAGVIIDASVSPGDYGIDALGDYTTYFSNFTLNNAGMYGLKISGENAFTHINHVTVNDSGRSGIDLNGVAGGTINNVTITGAIYGVGLALTDTSNVEVSNVTTSGNAWSGMAIYTKGSSYTGGSSNITLLGTNSFSEVLGLYFEEMNGFAITGINQTDFEFTVLNSTDRPNYVFFFKTQAEATAFALAMTTPSASVITDLTSDDFLVFPGMSIQAAHDAANPGDTIIVADGTYTYLTEGITLPTLPDLQHGLINIYKQITIKAADDGNTTRPVIDASSVDGVFKIHANTLVGGEIVIEGFDITGDKTTTGTAITTMFCGGDPATRVVINNNVIHGMIVGYNAWPSVAWCPAGTEYNVNVLEITNNEFSDLGITGVIPGYGIVLDGLSNWADSDNTYAALISGNTFNNIYTKGTLPTELGVGVVFRSGSANAQVIDNDFTGDISIAVALQGTDAATTDVSDNDFGDARYGVAAFAVTNGPVDASPNWWGTAVDNLIAAKTLSDVGGNVTYVPYWVTADMDLLSSTLPASVYVDDDFNYATEACGTYICGYTGFETIQEGVAGVATGGTINVAAGTYIEQLDITKDLTLVGEGVDRSSVIQAPATMPVASNPASAIVSIHGTGVEVEITGFTITGPGPTSCGSILAGIFVKDGAYANIHHNDILDIRDSVFSGCQNGVGIFVGRQSWATTGTATIANNLIDDYQKGGIVVDNAGSNAVITDNVITGEGNTDIIAQNGIQISRGATATITGNDISGNSFFKEGHPDNYASTGLLLYNAGSVTLSGGNVLSGNDQNINIYGTSPVSLGAETFGPLACELTHCYHVLADGADLDLSQSTFEGVNFATATPEQILPFAGRIWDGIDDGVSGVANLKDGYEFVDPEGKIQYAINHASTLETIFISDGTYVEDAVLSATLNPNKQLNFVGETTVTGEPLPVIAGSLTIDLPFVDDGWVIKNLNFQPVTTSTVLLSLKNVHGVTIENCVLDGANRFMSSPTLNGLLFVSGPNGNDHITVNDTIFQNGLYSGIQGYVNFLTINDSQFINVKSGINHQGGGGNLVVNNTDFSVEAQTISSDTYGIRFGSSALENLAISGGSITVDRNGMTADPGTYHSAIIIRDLASGSLSATGMSINGQVVNLSTTRLVATRNWWGSVTGPSAEMILEYPGDINYCNWLDAAPPAGVSVGGSVTNQTNGNIYCSIQAAINAAIAGDVLQVSAGIYDEDVLINKSITLAGAGAGDSVIRGVIGGENATIRIAASNITVEGFSITRLGNNLIDWNDPGLNFTGIAIQGQANTGAIIRNNDLYGNRTGIDINDSSGHTITGNKINNNRTGMIMRNRTDNLVVTGNEIADNWTVGVLFLDASSGSNSPLQQALGSFFNNNDLSGNWYGQVVDRQTGGSLPVPGTTNLKDFTGNWWGTTSITVSTANSAEPGYAAQIPVEFGGTAVPPTVPPADILGAASANILYCGWLDDAPPDGTPVAMPVENSTQGTFYCRIQDAINAANAGDTIEVGAGTYVEDLVIDKAITLLGPNAAINPNTGTRVSEAIILPPTTGALDVYNECSVMTYIETSGVTIKGFTFDGDNPALTSGVSIGSADVDACEIIAGWEGIGNTVIENNILKHSTYAGIEFYNYVNPAGTADNYITNNLLQNIGETTYNWGIGILLYNNFYADVTGNVLDGIRTGIQTGNYYLVNPGTTGTISNNTINVWRLGIFHNLWYGSASPITVSNNTINAIAYPGATKWNGMLISSFAGSANTVIQNNTINIPGSITFASPGYSVGYNVWNDATTNPLVISDGTVNGGDYGVFVNNFEGYSSNANNTRVTVDGVTISASTVAGVYVKDSPDNTNSATVYANIINNNIDTNGTGILIEGSDATADVFHNDIISNPTSGISNLNSGFMLDAEENWWGSIFGPQNPIVGTVDVVKWCSTSNPGCSPLLPDDSGVITIGPGTITDTGDFNIYVPGLTINLASGTTLNDPDSPCFNVYANNTKIYAESKLSATCIPGAGQNGVNVAAGLTDVRIKNIEFTGATAADGIHYAGAITGLNILDNWFHNLGGDAVEFTAAPTAPINIQGNLFQNNTGLGINASTFAVPAEFNSWGNADGAVAGDGKSANVDADPWTHVDLYLGASGVPGSYTYTVLGNLVNVMGASFTLQYPAGLTPSTPVNLSSFEAPLGADMFEVDTTARTITFNGAADAAITGDALPIYSVQFTGSATGILDLMDATDEFSMAPTTMTAPSTNIYAAVLFDGTLVTNAYTVTGTFSMQGRDVYNGIPGILTGTGLYGPYQATSIDSMVNNMVFSSVAQGTYIFTTNQPRYLNIPASMGKSVNVTTNRVLAALELKGGNAVWTDNEINILDASRVGMNYKKSTFVADADVNFDGVVNIYDLTLVGINYNLTSEAAYGSWVPVP